MTYHVLYNPHAGNGRGQEAAQVLTGLLPDDTLRFWDLTELCDLDTFFDGLPRADAVILAGGDGTLNRFLNDMVRLPLERDLYYFATGSGNDFFTDIGHQKGDAPCLLNPYLTDLPTVEVNGQKADPVNSTDPVVDISGLLQDGENALKITVTAPLTNRLLAMGRLREGVSGTHTVYSIRYHENGLSSVTLVPYVDQKLDVVEQGTVNLTVSGQDNATVDAKSLSFEIKASGAEKLATATLTIAVDGLVDPVVEAGEGWTIFRQQLVDGAIQVELGTMTGLTGDGVMATVSGGITGKPGAASVTVTQAVLSAYAGDSETFVAANLDNASARTEIDYSVYDVNRDGVVNQLDLTRTQRYYGTDDAICDVDNNGTVDIADLILILNNYSK